MSLVAHNEDVIEVGVQLAIWHSWSCHDWCQCLSEDSKCCRQPKFDGTKVVTSAEPVELVVYVGKWDVKVGVLQVHACYP